MICCFMSGNLNNINSIMELSILATNYKYLLLNAGHTNRERIFGSNQKRAKEQNVSQGEF